MRVLVADDDGVTRRILRAILEMLGFQVQEALSGKQAWERFDQHPVRIVLSDWVMPGLDGLELCRRIRARPQTPYTYYFLITGKRKNLRGYLQAAHADVDDFLFKPVDFHVVRNQILRARQSLASLERLREDFKEEAKAVALRDKPGLS
jgi:PleD family two-component response regulator